MPAAAPRRPGVAHDARLARRPDVPDPARDGGGPHLHADAGDHGADRGDDRRRERWRTSFRLGGGLAPRPDLPILLAALSPATLRLAGEIADGVLLWLCAPAYVREVVIPCVREGRERAGRTLAGFAVVPAAPVAVTGDEDAAHRAMRRDLAPYFGLASYREMLGRSGFAADVAAFDAGGAEAISASCVRALGAVGDADAIGAALRAYLDAGATTPCVAPARGADAEATLRAAIAAM